MSGDPEDVFGGTRVFAGTGQPPIERAVPGPGQESVWDYPRPPGVESVSDRIRVAAMGITIADSRRALRVVETAGAPVYYLPPADIRTELLRTTDHHSVCEFKGLARYYDIVAGDHESSRAAWSYPQPSPGFEDIADHLAFYVWAVDEAWVGTELATAQPGRFYGGWVTSRVVGPFKGDPGTEGW